MRAHMWIQCQHFTCTHAYLQHCLSRPKFVAQRAHRTPLMCDATMTGWWTQCSRKGGFGATMVGSPAAHHQLSQELSHDLCWAAWDGDFAALPGAQRGCARSTKRWASLNRSGWPCPTTCESLGWPAWCPQPGRSCVPRTSSFRGTNALVVGQNFVSDDNEFRSRCE